MSSVISFLVGLVSIGAIYSVLVLGLNTQFGKCGQINFGVAGFFAIGAYTYVLTTVPAPGSGDQYLFGLGLPMWLGFVLSGIVAALFAWLIGLPTLKLKAENLALITFAVSEIVRYLATNESWLTNGVRGITHLPRPFQAYFSSDSYEYVLAAILILALIITFLFVNKVEQAPLGRLFRAVRENEEVALASGKNVNHIKMVSFVMGCAITGYAGALYMWYIGLIVPGMFAPEITFTLWIAMIIGGSGNDKGVILGTFILVAMQELIRLLPISSEFAGSLMSFRTALEGIILIAILRFRPSGIWPEAKRVDNLAGEGEVDSDASRGA